MSIYGNTLNTKNTSSHTVIISQQEYTNTK